MQWSIIRRPFHRGIQKTTNEDGMWESKYVNKFWVDIRDYKKIFCFQQRCPIFFSYLKALVNVHKKVNKY